MDFQISVLIILLFLLPSYSSSPNFCSVSLQQMGASALYQYIKEALNETITVPRSNGSHIRIVTYLSHDIIAYAAYALAINFAYARSNGYVLEILDETSSNFEPRDQRWNRVKILLDRLDSALKLPQKEGQGSKSEYLVWMDADLIFTNHSHTLDNYIANYPNADILLSAERHAATGVGNTGCIIVKVSSWSLQFFHKWWNNYDRSLDHDQIYFNILYRSMLPEITEHVAILPSHALNSHPPAALHQKEDHYVLHLMGERMDVRSSVFYKGYLNLCYSYNRANTVGNEVVTPLPQLGLSKRVLLRTTFERHRSRYQELYEFSFTNQRINEVDISIFLTNTTELREIMIQGVKYVSFLLEQQNDEDSTILNEMITADSLYDRMVLNKLERLKVREMMFAKTKEIISVQVVTSNRSIAVQLLNACAVFGHDLANEMESPDQKTILLDDIHLILKELRQLVSLESTFLVDEMISGNYLSQGIISSSIGDEDDAVIYFQEAIDVLEKNPNRNVFHLIPPLSLLGIEKCKIVNKALAVQEGINILSRSIELQRQILNPEKQLKENHLDFASDILHRASCRVTNMADAVDRNAQLQLIFSDIEQAREILEVHPEERRATSIWSHFDNVIRNSISARFENMADVNGMNLSQIIRIEANRSSDVKEFTNFTRESDSTVFHEKGSTLSSSVKKVYKRRKKISS